MRNFLFLKQIFSAIVKWNYLDFGQVNKAIKKIGRQQKVCRASTSFEYIIILNIHNSSFEIKSSSTTFAFRITKTKIIFIIIAISECK